ncbi:MAG: flagellar basal body-associated protein FliL [Burkholderiales bacterium]|nr:flagellar basal body-associated protein FliL [Sulfuricellaceae bacterium]
MAKDQGKKPVQAESDSAEAKGGGKKKILIIVAVMVLLGSLVGGVAAWFLLGDAKHEEAAKTAELPPPPLFYSLEAFTVNLQGDSHYLQVGIDLKISDPKVGEAIKLHMPEIRNGILLLLSSKGIDDVISVEGKKKLSGEILEHVNKPLGMKDPRLKVLGVYFTSFVVQ